MSFFCVLTNRYPSPVSPPLENEKDANHETLKIRGREESSGFDSYDPLTHGHRSPPNHQHYERGRGGVAPFNGGYTEAIAAGGQRAFAAGNPQYEQEQAQGQRQDSWCRSGADWPSQGPAVTPPPETSWGKGQGQASWYAHPHPHPQCNYWGQSARTAPTQYQYQQLTPYYYTESPAQLNASAPAFSPVSVSTVSLIKRMSGVNKRVRFNQQPDSATVSATTLLQKTSTKKAPKPQCPQTRSRQLSKSSPRLQLMKRPSPTPVYLARAAQEPRTLDASRPLLVILDLNGTLLYRKNRGAVFTKRPHVHEFLDYLFTNHRVMVWSSARPENVEKMCKTLFAPAQHKQIVAIWARDRLGLNNYMYNQKVQVYKQLSWVFEDRGIQATKPMPGIFWSQANTVLIDDTIEKAASEPHNIVQIEEFEARQDQMEADVLGQVALYLDNLRSQQDASSYMMRHPFTYDPNPPSAARSEASSGEEGGVSLASA